jgi:hypothetical protein|tara:strand:+ start:715 stop:882 length:168 start_codon:yes stop_codon:yes gene_type:complete
MEGQIQMYHYRLEAIITKVKEMLIELEELEATSGNMSYDQSNKLQKIITELKKIQ